MAAPQLGKLRGEPGGKLGQERGAELSAARAPLGRSLAAQRTLDVKQGIEALPSFERDWIGNLGKV